MSVVWYIVMAGLAVIAALLIWALFQPLDLSFSLRIEGLEIELATAVHYSRIHRSRTWTLPVLPPRQHASQTHFHLTPELIDEALWAYEVLNRTMDALWHRMHIEAFDLHATIGFADAARTAVWTGRATDLLAWWIGMRIAPRAHQAPRFLVEPNWDQAGVSGNFTSIIRVQPSDIILAIIRGLTGPAKGGQEKYGHTAQQHA